MEHLTVNNKNEEGEDVEEDGQAKLMSCSK